MFISKKNYRKFEDKALAPGTKVVSADIFDTLLLRTPKPEFHRFFDIAKLQLDFLHGKNLVLNTRSKDMLILRILAAKAAYRNVPIVSGVREAKYFDFMKIILKSLKCPVELSDELREIEIAYEKSVLAANPVLVATFKKAQESGKRIIWISDMYFSATDISSIVKHHIPGLDFSGIYASSEYGISKASGKLYDYVAKQEGVKQKEIVHCGDSFHSDFHMAEKQGVQAVYVPRTMPWRFFRGQWQKIFNKYYGVV